MADTSPALADLPVELARHRVLNTPDTCKFLGISVAQWRELRRLGETPPPIMLGTKKQGWRILDLIRWIESRGEQAAERKQRAPKGARCFSFVGAVVRQG
jgi:predicted DNA-binding transcriptional regulator AlpA